MDDYYTMHFSPRGMQYVHKGISSNAEKKIVQQFLSCREKEN